VDTGPTYAALAEAGRNWRCDRQRLPAALAVRHTHDTVHGEARMIADGQLAEHEQRIVAAVVTGEVVDLSVGGAHVGDPADGAMWAPERTVRAELLIELLTAERTSKTGRLRAVRIRGARIIGSLDLEARVLACPLTLQECSIGDPVSLDEATAPAIRLPGCHVPALSAAQLQTIGNLQLDHGFTAEGEVRLLGAKVGGQLSFDGASLRNPGGRALSADGLMVEQSMFCGDGFTAEGRCGCWVPRSVAGSPSTGRPCAIPAAGR
jgi:hypothetical protein